MQRRGEVLVAIMNKELDFVVANEQHWYRIPVLSVHKWIKDAWPPQVIAFYQTKIFRDEKYAVNYFAEVNHIEMVKRRDLFPSQPEDTKSDNLYYKIFLKPLEKLEKPIISRRLRRLVFIPSTFDRLQFAEEINDLYHGTSLEEIVWNELKKLSIPAEREEYIETNGGNYFLDFAIYCAKGSIDLETDGDYWHANSKKAFVDNNRNNALEELGWSVIRFNDKQIQEEMEPYCIPTIINTINKLGGIEEGQVVSRKIKPKGPQQPSLFEDIN